MAPLSPAWLSHHDESEASRCIKVGDTHVCRRCAALYAGFIPGIVLLIALAGYNPTGLDISIVGIAAVLGIVDFVGVVTGKMKYSAQRVLWLGLPLGVGWAWITYDAWTEGLGVVQFSLMGIAGVLALVLVVTKKRA